MVAYYQRSISAWMDGTESLDDGEYRVYDVVCNLIYLNDGPIVMHESGIAGRCNQHPLKFRRNFQKLVERGKLIIRTDGKITNARVESELKKIAGRKRGATADPPRTPAPPLGGAAGVDRGLAGGSGSKPLKNQELPLSEDRVDKIRKNTIANAMASEPSAVMPNPPLDPEADYYRRGREVLGANAGGVLTQLIRAKGGNLALARAAIEQASTRGDAREYVGAMIRNNRKGGSDEANRNGTAAPRGRGSYGTLAAKLRNRIGADHERDAAGDQPRDGRRDTEPRLQLVDGGGQAAAVATAAHR
jgi:hypothetical protein